MTRAILKGGKSLSARIRAFHPSVSNDVIAYELAANPRTVAVVRAKQKKPHAYRSKANTAQNLRRRRRIEEAAWSWATDYANTFKCVKDRDESASEAMAAAPSRFSYGENVLT